MDEKDKKILYELDRNSRLPINTLAKRVGVSKEVANYRLKRLVREKYILHFQTEIDMGLLGYSRYGCFIQLKNVNNAKEKQILDFLYHHDFVTYFGPIVGRWNVAFDLVTKDRIHLEEMIREIKKKYHNYLESLVVINSSAESEYFPLKFLGQMRAISEVRVRKVDVRIDEKDVEILRVLSTNPRAEYSFLSSKLHLSANAIKYRIKNLEKEGVIRGYTISIDVRKLGYAWHDIQIKLVNEEKNDLIKSYLRKNVNTIYYYKFLGHENWDMDIGVAVRNASELRQFILELREEFGEEIKIHDIYSIVEMSKPNIVPKGVFDQISKNKFTQQ